MTSIVELVFFAAPKGNDLLVLAPVLHRRLLIIFKRYWIARITYFHRYKTLNAEP